MRSRFRRAADRVFRVDLTVHRLESIPIIHRNLYIHWQARRAIPADGRTPSKPVESGNTVTWETTICFTISIPSDASDPTLLQPSPMTMRLRSERRTRWVGMSYTEEGSFDMDLSEIAAVGSLQRSDIFQGSLLNMILRTSIRITHVSGDKIFRTRTLPAIYPVPLVKTSTPSTPTAGASASSEIATALLPDDRRRESTDRMSADAAARPFLRASSTAPHLPSMSSLTPAASSNSLFQDAEASDELNNILVNSIPNPEVAQRDVYERIFQERLRDNWPEHVLRSRVDAASVVNEVYASECAADGIGVVAVRGEPVKSAPLALEEEEEGGQPGATPQVVLTRKASGRSPHLSVRSSSMGELSSKRLGMTTLAL